MNCKRQRFTEVFHWCLGTLNFAIMDKTMQNRSWLSNASRCWLANSVYFVKNSILEDPWHLP